MPDIHTSAGVISESDLELMEPRMRAFIFPNQPRTDEERAAFDKAVRFQIDHERTMIENGNAAAEIPNGTKAFTIGNFHMEFSDGLFDSRLTRKTICPSAYGVLLTAGLLYRGIEGGCCSHGTY